MRTLILFLSAYDGKPEAPYTTDRDFCVTGAQTNEAPVRYAAERLSRDGGKKLDRIIALVTPKAKETAYERFSGTVGEISPATRLDSVEIADNVTTTELLRETIKKLQPLEQSDSVIIETTGGFRNAVNALTLLARFLRYNGIGIDFSTYSDLGLKHVSETKEADRLFELLDATNIFAVYANPGPLIAAIGKARIPYRENFERAIKNFYDVMLCCKTAKLDSAMGNLRNAIENVINAEYEPEDATALIFRDLISELLQTKLAFIRIEKYLLPLIKWCCENGYLVQAIIFLMENVLSEMRLNEKTGKFDRSKTAAGEKAGNYSKIKQYRDEIAHGLNKSNATVKKITEDVLETVRQIENNPLLKLSYV